MKDRTWPRPAPSRPCIRAAGPCISPRLPCRAETASPGYAHAPWWRGTHPVRGRDKPEGVHMPLYETVFIARNDVTQQQVEAIADAIGTQLDADKGIAPPPPPPRASAEGPRPSVGQEARVLGPARPGLPDQEEPQGPLHAARHRRRARLGHGDGAPARPQRGRAALHDHPAWTRSRRPRAPSCRASPTTASAASAGPSRPGASNPAASAATTTARSSAPATTCRATATTSAAVEE